jgi:hypothetical protein
MIYDIAKYSESPGLWPIDYALETYLTNSGKQRNARHSLLSKYSSLLTYDI